MDESSYSATTAINMIVNITTILASTESNGRYIKTKRMTQEVHSFGNSAAQSGDALVSSQNGYNIRFAVVRICES
jgi:hypothetical protein